MQNFHLFLVLSYWVSAFTRVKVTQLRAPVSYWGRLLKWGQNSTVQKNTTIQFKSYKLAVPRSEFNKLFNENLWPKGVYVRTYWSQKTRIKVVFRLDCNFFPLFSIVLLACMCTMLYCTPGMWIKTVIINNHWYSNFLVLASKVRVITGLFEQ